MKVTLNIDVEIEAESPQEAYRQLDLVLSADVEDASINLWNSINYTTDEDEEVHEMEEAFGPPSYNETHSYTRNAHTCVGGDGE